MADKKVYIIKNLNRRSCNNCGNVHDFISRASKHARCGTPLGTSLEFAHELASVMHIDTDEGVILAPDDTLVILDDSARKLRRQNSASVPLDQVFMGMQTMR